MRVMVRNRLVLAGTVMVIGLVLTALLAGLIAALLHGGADEDPALIAAAALDDPAAGCILSAAVASASLCVMRTGCQPPDRDAVRQRQATHPPRVQRHTTA